MADGRSEKEQGSEGSVSTTNASHSGATDALAAIQRTLSHQQRILRAIDHSKLTSHHAALAQVSRSLIASPALIASSNAMTQASQLSKEFAKSTSTLAALKMMSPSVERARLAEIAGVHGAAAMMARVEIPTVRYELAASTAITDLARVASLARDLDRTAIVLAKYQGSLTASIGAKVSTDWAALMQKHELMRSVTMSPRFSELARISADMTRIHNAVRSIRPLSALVSSHHVDAVTRTLKRASWMQHQVADALAIATSVFELKQGEEALDEEKARLAEVIERTPGGLILPPGAATLRQPEEVTLLYDMLGSSPYHWVKSDGGLLVALTKSHITYATTRFGTADELVEEVARDGRLHDLVASNLLAYGHERVEGFRDGSAFYVQGRPFSAIPVLINHLEGVIVEAAINIGYLERDPNCTGKPRYKKGGKPIGGVEEAIKGLANSGVLAQDEQEYFIRHVYGGRGNAYRHGQPLTYDQLQAARLILGFYLVTDRARGVA